MSLSVWRKISFLALILAAVAFGAIAAVADGAAKPVPVPLAPGINKGNVDNIGGARYYSFWAGPGVVTVNMAFKDMGVFGNPLRQVMHFNIYLASGTLLSSYTVESVDKLEHNSVSGPVAARTQYVIEVKAQDAVIRMGGYYELSVTGAVEFGSAKIAVETIR